MFENIKNTIDFFIRNKTKFTRKNFVEKNLENIKRNELENLYTKDILEKFFKKTQKDSLKILDIGCKNWFYLKGEWDFFNSFCDNFFLDGVELDAYRLYNNFYSRIETAKYYMKNYNNVKYIADDLLNIEEKYDFIIWILPFVLKKSLIYWGLPEKYFCPEKLLIHSYNLLNENGQLLIINQGEKEAQKQEELLISSKIQYKKLNEIKSSFYEYKNKRFGFLITKKTL